MPCEPLLGPVDVLNLDQGMWTATARMRRRPKRAPIQYKATAPTNEPNVVHSSASASENSPRLAVKPASGRMISLGSGGNRFSSAIASPAPAPPSRSIKSTAQPATPVSSSSLLDESLTTAAQDVIPRL
jgi:hypothetical protein